MHLYTITLVKNGCAVRERYIEVKLGERLEIVLVIDLSDSDRRKTLNQGELNCRKKYKEPQRVKREKRKNVSVNK